MKALVVAVLLLISGYVHAETEKIMKYTNKDCERLRSNLQIIADKQQKGVDFNVAIASLYRPSVLSDFTYRASLWMLVFSSNKFYEVPNMDQSMYIGKIYTTCMGKVGTGYWTYYE